MGHYSEHNFSYTIEDVLDLLPLTVRHRGNRHATVDCPFCTMKRRGKLDINIEKNVYRCNYNPEHHGGMIALYANYHGISNSDAHHEIEELLHRGGEDDAKRRAERKLQREQAAPIAERAELETIHQTYSLLLSMLTLAKPHLDNLRARGLSDEDIRKHGYKSIPVFGYKRIAQTLLERGCVLEGVPGFYRDAAGEWTIKFTPYCSGFLVPALSLDGRIQGAQIRLDHPIDRAKYIWLSSIDERDGAGPGSPIHFVGDPAAKVVYITEGGLKGNVAHVYSGKAFGCSAGVNQYASLETFFKQIKRTGVETVVDAYDMDRNVNPGIEAAATEMLSLARACGLKTDKLRWNPKYKGIDDFLVATHKTGTASV